jgi:hypothetical protein
MPRPRNPITVHGVMLPPNYDPLPDLRRIANTNEELRATAHDVATYIVQLEEQLRSVRESAQTLALQLQERRLF